MTMKFSIILAHPKLGSFNHAIADAAIQILHGSGHAVHYHDLHAEQFNPVTPAEEIAKDCLLPPAIEQHCLEIEAADGIVIVHPNWWSQPPAILKGWLDRVLRPGRAYNFVASPSGEVKPVGLLKAKSALVINTANTPQDKEVAFLGDPQALIWEKVVFGLCGVPRVTRLVFSPVIVSTLEQRRQWLEEVRSAVAAMGC
jgi:NAD(P)H dehydrogenase (quinone)